MIFTLLNRGRAHHRDGTERSWTSSGKLVASRRGERHLPVARVAASPHSRHRLGDQSGNLQRATDRAELDVQDCGQPRAAAGMSPTPVRRRSSLPAACRTRRRCRSRTAGATPARRAPWLLGRQFDRAVRDAPWVKAIVACCAPGPPNVPTVIRFGRRRWTVRPITRPPAAVRDWSRVAVPIVAAVGAHKLCQAQGASRRPGSLAT
jgi:hypothetical protein